MSANRWSPCPRCKVRKNAELDRMSNELKLSYGKVLADDYMAGVDALERSRKAATQIPDSLREDWEIYLDDNILRISYGCSCTDCGLAFEYTKDVVFYEGEEEL